MTRLLSPSASALTALAVFATAQSSCAQTLAGRPDRYGSADVVPSPDAVRASAPVQLRTRFLSWPGKVPPAAPPALRTGFAMAPVSLDDRGAWRRVPTAPVDVTEPARRGSAAAQLWNPPPAVASQAYTPPRTAWVRAASQEAMVRRAPDVYLRRTPNSIYDVPEPMGDPSSPAEPALRGRRDVSAPAPPAPPANRTQQAAFATPPRLRPANGEGVRFYSVHRAFGLQPDPAPIPPQFFAATPDLSDPPGPSPNRKIAAGAGVSTVAARSAVQAQDGDAAAQP